MTIKGGSPLDPADLRRRAEELLRKKPDALAAIPPEEAGRLLHELQVHQIELEMQNYELRGAQQEIEASRVKYLDLFDWAPVGYFTVGEKGLILKANYMAAELLGVERNLLLKQPLTRYILPEDKDIYYLHRKCLLETGVRQVFELRMCRQDGSPFWAWLVTDAAWDGKDGLPVYRTTVSDITERKRAEEEIRESSDRLRAIFQASPLPIVCLELDGTVKIWNRAAEVIFGWTEDEVVGHLLPFVPEDKMGEFHALLAQGHKGFLNGVEVRRRRKDGSPIDISIWASPLFDQKGNAAGIMAVIADITERKRSEEAHTRLSMAVDQASEGIVITDTEGRIEYVNPSFERITGYLQKEAVGQNMRILKSGKQDEMFYRNMWETISRGEVWRGHFINKKKDGTLYEEGTIISPVRNTSGKIINFVAGKRDITRDVMQQKQVQTAQRMESVGTLAGGIAHDFNNVLTVIIGYGEMLKLRIAYDPDAVSDLDEILREAERASVLTRQLLTFARRQVVEPVNLDLSEVMTDLVKLIRKVTREDIEIKTFPAECPVMIRADRGQVEQVLMNLFLNARDAMPEGGQLVIETRMTLLEEGYLKQYPYMKAGRYAVVSVSDTGVGMDEKTRERIFEPFFTTKGPDKGTGLGLAMVYGIVKQHNGFIHVFSEPGKGTTFRVYFPEVDAPADAKVIASQGVAHGGSETILLAEDNESVRHLTEQMLISYGYKVLIACDGEEALDIFRRHGKEIAMVVLDVVMPKKGGKQAYDEMIRTIPELKVLFLSGYSANAIHESFVLLPGLFFLQKPFGPDVLARKVREMLDRK